MRSALIAACVLLVLSGCVTAPNAEPSKLPGPDPSWVFAQFTASEFGAFRERPETLQYWAGWIQGVHGALCHVPVAPAVLDHSLGILIRSMVHSCLFDNVSASSLAERAVQGGEWHLVGEWQGQAEEAHADSVEALSDLRLTSVADVEVAALLMSEALGNAEALDHARRLRDELAETPDVDDVRALFDHYHDVSLRATALTTMSRLFVAPGAICAGPDGDAASQADAGLTALLAGSSTDPEKNRTDAYHDLGFLAARLDRTEALEWWPYALDVLSRMPFYEAQLEAAGLALPSYDEATDLWWTAANTTPRSIWRDYHLQVIPLQEPPAGHPVVQGQALRAVAAGSLDSGWRFDDARCPAAGHGTPP